MPIFLFRPTSYIIAGLPPQIIRGPFVVQLFLYAFASQKSMSSIATAATSSAHSPHSPRVLAVCSRQLSAPPAAEPMVLERWGSRRASRKAAQRVQQQSLPVFQITSPAESREPSPSLGSATEGGQQQSPATMAILPDGSSSGRSLREGIGQWHILGIVRATGRRKIPQNQLKRHCFGRKCPFLPPFWHRKCHCGYDP